MVDFPSHKCGFFREFPFVHKEGTNVDFFKITFIITQIANISFLNNIYIRRLSVINFFKKYFFKYPRGFKLDFLKKKKKENNNKTLTAKNMNFLRISLWIFFKYILKYFSTRVFLNFKNKKIKIF